MSLFPAHAGMNRWAVQKPSGSSSVPRTRGDEPQVSSRLNVVSVLFPAHAGMNRRINRRQQAKSPVPRTRGDEPRNRNEKGGGYDCSPHTRG